MSKRMRKIKLSPAISQDAVDFSFGDRRTTVKKEATEIDDDTADLIEAQYPEWTERVSSPKAPTATPAKAGSTATES